MFWVFLIFALINFKTYHKAMDLEKIPEAKMALFFTFVMMGVMVMCL